MITPFCTLLNHSSRYLPYPPPSQNSDLQDMHSGPPESGQQLCQMLQSILYRNCIAQSVTKPKSNDVTAAMLEVSLTLLQQCDVVNSRTIANCCAWNHIPVEIRDLLINLGAKNCLISTLNSTDRSHQLYLQHGGVVLCSAQ